MDMTDFRISFLDKTDPIDKKFWDVIPHWDQFGKTQFVTFRLADSLPQAKLDELRFVKDQFIQKHPRPWDEKTSNLFHSLYGKKLEYWIDQGYGACILKYSLPRDNLLDAILRYHKIKYYFHELVIMPNHVHVLMNPMVIMDAAMKQIKGSSASVINKTVGRRGQLWATTDFDRMVRSEDSFRYYVDYIHKNPRGLPSGTFTLWSDPDQLWQKTFNKS